MAAHTKIDLYQMQSLPLDAKIRMTARRIDAFIDRNDAYISISGGKDSRVLDDIERRFVRAKLRLHEKETSKAVRERNGQAAYSGDNGRGKQFEITKMVKAWLQCF